MQKLKRKDKIVHEKLGYYVIGDPDESHSIQIG